MLLMRLRQCGGRKKGSTQVIRAKGGEKLGQKFEGGVETYEYEAKEGEAIFVNSPTDQYVPPFEDGRLQVDDLEKAGFEIASKSEDGGNLQVMSPKSRLLPSIVDARICIKGAWGDPSDEKNSQFLSKGATLKVKGDGSISSGMDKEGFEKWEVISSYEGQSNIPKVK